MVGFISVLLYKPIYCTLLTAPHLHLKVFFIKDRLIIYRFGGKLFKFLYAGRRLYFGKLLFHVAIKDIKLYTFDEITGYENR